MKKILVLSLIAGFFAVISFSSCNKVKNTSTSTPVESTATIKGKIQCDLNADGTKDAIPSGTKVYAQIDAKDLIDNPDPLYNYGKIQYSTTIGSDGTYSMSVAAGTKSVAVTLFCDDIYSTTTTPYVINGPTGAATVYKNLVQIVDMNY